ncbi:hypothetical protein B296_00035897 [Ensete ventricosum]|uniref:Uncharacterized protein n=1 Tax=Ensete ventricosum TaxID=4639 RepID=A0A426XP85_ENSVE|nr:hypothetical protein B296_00035897 [Ensete ventricosum]
MVLKKVVERGEEATMSLMGLSYPKAKRRLERRWTRRSITVPQRQIYRSRRKGCRCKTTDSRVMDLAAPCMAYQSSTTQQRLWRAVGSQRGMLQPKQKIEDLSKCEEMQRLKRLQ